MMLFLKSVLVGLVVSVVAVVVGVAIEIAIAFIGLTLAGQGHTRGVLSPGSLGLGDWSAVGFGILGFLAGYYRTFTRGHRQANAS